MPSPEPHAVVEADEIKTLADEGVLVVCGGGGCVPVVRDADDLCGVEAVVDKDRTSRLLAEHLDADLLVFLTDVEYAYVNYGEDEQRPLESVDAEELHAHLEAGEFGEGTMLPKVESMLGFVESNEGAEAVITTPESFGDALEGEAGTRLRG